jgi:UDP-N-acetylmuramoylalanine--D-glutamate ligase
MKTHTEALILNADVVMKVLAFLKSSHRQEAGRKGIPVISEIEFAAPFTNAVTIGITAVMVKQLLC